MTLLIKNGRIVNADSTQQADVLCKDGKILKIGKDLESDSNPDKIIDAKGCYIFPGGIDPHVHMYLPTQAGFSADDFLSGSKAALYGGNTTLIDFVTPIKGESLAKAIEKRKSEAINCLTDFSFHVSPIEWRNTMSDEIKDCVILEGLKSFKTYMAYKDSIGLNDDILFKVMKVVGKAGGIVTIHCELGDEIDALRNDLVRKNKTEPKFHPISRPDTMESKAVKKAIELGKEAKCPIYIVHVSAKKSLKYILEAQENGQAVLAESCPQYLLLKDVNYKGEFQKTSAYVMSPPLRKKKDQKALWKSIDHQIIDTIGTDHCSFTLEQKKMGVNDFRKIPNGAGGVEHRLALLYTYGVMKAKISLNRFVALTSTNAAKIFGLFPTKGMIAVGSDADILVWDPKVKKTISANDHHQNCDVNIYEGMKTKGAPAFVIKNGIVVIENDQLIKNPVKGRFLKTNSL